MKSVSCSVEYFLSRAIKICETETSSYFVPHVYEKIAVTNYACISYYIGRSLRWKYVNISNGRRALLNCVTWRCKLKKSSREGTLIWGTFSRKFRNIYEVKPNSAVGVLQLGVKRSARTLGVQGRRTSKRHDRVSHVIRLGSRQLANRYLLIEYGQQKLTT